MKNSTTHIQVFYEQKDLHIKLNLEDHRKVPSHYLQNKVYGTAIIAIDHNLDPSASFEQMIKIHLKRFKHKVIKYQIMESVNLIDG